MSSSGDTSPVSVVGAYNPFDKARRYHVELPEGLTLLQMVEATMAAEARYVVVCVGDQAVPRELWARVRPKAGALVTINVLPVVHDGGGEGGKSPLRTVLTLAVVAAAFTLGGPLGSTIFGASTISLFGATISTATIGSGIIGLTGSLLVNAVAPIRPRGTNNALSGTSGTSGGASLRSESPTLSITGVRNEARPWSVIPAPLGRHRMTPPLGALPFTEIVQESDSYEQFLMLVVVWGVGPLDIRDLKILETPLDNFRGVEVYTRQGYLDDPPLRLVTNDVFEDQISVLLTQAEGWYELSAISGSEALSVDIIFPRGLVTFDDEGNRLNRTVTVDVEFAPVDTQDWLGAEAALPQRESPVLPAETGTKSTPQGDLPADDPRRCDLVYLERGTGEIKVLRGTTSFSGESPQPCTGQVGRVPLAEVVRGTGATIEAGDITDRRPDDPPWSGGGDFLVTPTSPPSDKVLVAAGTLHALGFTVTARQTEAVRRSVTWDAGPPGDYKVRLRRATADTSSSQILDEVRWTAIRSIDYRPPFDPTGLATTELRIQASDQLNRVIDQLNGVVTTIALDWEPGAQEWLLRPTTNNASLGRHVLQGAANPNPRGDAELELEAFQRWHERCTAQGFEFNMVRDFPSSVWDTFADIASASMAALANPSGKWSVVLDEPGKVPVQHFTPRNSRGFSFERFYVDEVHAWRMRFINEREGWQPDELILYFEGYNADGSGGLQEATVFEEFEQVGITDPDLLWKIAKRRVAEAYARPERYTWSTDIESLVCVRGDVVLVSTHVISVGQRSGRVTAVVSEGPNATAVDIDERVAMALGTSYGAVFRSVNEGKLAVPLRTTVGDRVGRLEFADPIPLANAPMVDDLFTFGELGLETLEVVLVGATWDEDQGVRLTGIPYAQPAIEDATEGGPPPFQSAISRPPGAVTPFVVRMRSDETVLRRLPSGLLEPQIQVTLGRPSASVQRRLNGVEVQYRERGVQDHYNSVRNERREALEVLLPGVVQDRTYEIRLRYILEGDDSDFSSLYFHEVEGMRNPPPDVPRVVLEGDFLRWNYPNPPLDFLGFVVRYSTNIASGWEAALPAHDGVLDQAELDVSNLARGQVVFLVRAVDQARNPSTNPSRLTRDLGDPLVANVVAEVDFAALGWPGTLTGGQVVDGALRANTSTLFLPNRGEPFLFNPTDPFLGVSNYEAMAYTPDFVSTEPEWVPSRLTVELVGHGAAAVSYDVGEYELFLPDRSEPFLQPDTDPFLPPVFSGQKRAFPAFLDLVQRPVLQFYLDSPAGELATLVQSMKLVYDVPDEEETFPDTVVPAGGLRLPVTKDFRYVTVVNYVQQFDGGDAVRFLVLDKGVVRNDRLVQGPQVQALNAAGQGTQGFADFTIQGARR